MSSISYNDFISAIHNYYAIDNPYNNLTWAQVSNDFLEWGVDRTNYYQYIEQFPEIFNIHRTLDGKIADVTLTNNTYFGGYENIGQAVNSNEVGSIASNRVNLKIPNIVKTSTTGQLELTGGIGLKADTGLTATGVLSTIGVAIGAVGIGAKLGKIVGDSLYTSNPTIWNDGIISGLSQVDWNKFATTLKDDVSGRVQNGILGLFGVDGDNTTMYLDENAVGYLTWYLSENHFFDETTSQSVDESTLNDLEITNPIGLGNCNSIKVGSPRTQTIPYILDATGKSFDIESYKTSGEAINSAKFCFYEDNYNNFEQVNCIIATEETLSGNTNLQYGIEFSTGQGSYAQKISSSYTRENKKVNFYSLQMTNPGNYELPLQTNAKCREPYRRGLINEIAWAMIYGKINTESSGYYDGVTRNDNSTQFDPTGIGSVSTALGALRNQFPELWDNSITKTVPQEDGSEEEHIYLPIPIPKFNNAFDTQPTTGTPDQKDPQVDPSTTPEEDQKNLADTIAPPTNPSDDANTGTGDTPTIITPTQQASSLWAIYNPSLSQLNRLGSWLWSTDFIDQLLKIFNDPMQAIIGLHKVYATPVISGSGNIKVGYLDSNVPSNIVGNQYTYIDCGSVSLREYYGNVLDYSPYTTVQLYLPFIGIVSLDIADVSRSTISVKYGVDVLTGACLASVSVQRDNAGGVLYQYSGNCACQYPLSSGSYMGMVTGMIGAVGSLARGNIFGSAMSVAGMHTNIEHSGGFSGNAGAMGAKKPYLIVSRPQSAMNDGFPSIQGYPSNYYIRLGNCSGYTQVAECHVENIPATEKELDKIKDLLKEGIIL